MKGSKHVRRIAKSHHPAQSAMEYLMTYGWAILIISIVLFSLFQLGVFNSSGSTPTAQPGSCRVAKLYSVNGGVQASLLGSCSGLKPQFLTQFNGASSDVQLSSAPVSGAGSFTVLAWIKTNATAAQGIMTVGNTACGSGASLSVDSSGYLVEGLSCSGPTSNPTIVNDGKYHFVGLVYAGPTSNTVQLYVDGAAAGSSVSQSIDIGTGSSYIGEDAASNHFNGIIANVQIYNTSLSANEIQILYQEGLGGAPIPLPGMVGWWPLNGDTKDYSGSGNNGVPTGLSGGGVVSGGGSSSTTTIPSVSLCYTLTLTPDTGGTATANPANSVGCATGYFASGETITLTANANSGYDFSGWTGTSSSISNPLTFTMPGSDASETAGFVAATDGYAQPGCYLTDSCAGQPPQFVMQFDGASSDVSTGISGFPTGSGPSSACAWIYMPSQGGSPAYPVFGYGTTTSSDEASIMFINSAYGGNLNFFDGANAHSAYNAIPGSWNSICWTYDGGTTLALYVDGILGYPDPGSIGNPFPITQLNVVPSTSDIGYINSMYGPFYFQGLISNVQLYNTALSSSDVAALNAEGIGGAPLASHGIVGWWPLNGDVKDYSGSGNNGVPFNVVLESGWPS